MPAHPVYTFWPVRGEDLGTGRWIGATFRLTGEGEFG